MGDTASAAAADGGSVKLPSHWAKRRLSSLARAGYKTFTDGDWVELPHIVDEGIRLIQTGNIGVGDYREQGFRYISEDSFRELGCTEVLPGDVLICRLADPVGRACLAPKLDSRMITSVDVCILKPAEWVDARFLVYYLSSDSHLGYMDAIGRGGTRTRISRSQLGQLRVPVPTHAEQVAISDFLDRETERIDRLVEKKRRLIELLEEKRTALISHAVTKGLDRTVPTKDSGIPWLGEVPAHWEVTKIGRIAHLVSGVGFPDESQGVLNEELPFYKVSDMNLPGNERYMIESANTVSRKTAAELGGRIMEKGAILFPKVGAAMLTNKRRILTVPSLFDNNTMALGLRRGEPEYFHYLLDNVDFSEIAQQGPVPSISAGTVREVKVPLPPSNEQRDIVSFIDARSESLGTGVTKLIEQLNKLAEYRQALITAAVTGQIGVPETQRESEEAIA